MGAADTTSLLDVSGLDRRGLVCGYELAACRPLVTTVLLPTTVVTGIWGMNVGGMPWADEPRGFLYTCLTLLGSVLLSLAVLRRTRVL